MRGILASILVVLISGVLQPRRAHAQSLTTGAIAGVVTDPTGAVIPKANVTVSNLDTGQKRETITGPGGTYTVSLLQPGQYKVLITAAGFQVAELGPITVGVSQTANADASLQVGSRTEVFQVTAAPQLIELSNPNTTTTVTSREIAALPNPGNDLTYLAQVAPGAIMNTGGGPVLSGNNNVEFNGLPATSINLTIDGMDGSNNGATNLSLGLNAISEASINTLSYSVDQGRYGAAQVNYISKSGTNKWHGNVFETWNGRSMDAADWFINAQPGPSCSAADQEKCKPFSNMNEFGGSLGGPLIKNKLFLFGDVEGIRIVLPEIAGEAFPSQAYENYVLSQIPKGGYDPQNGITYTPPPNPAPAIAYYKQAFALYGTPSGGIPYPTSDCAVNGDGSIIALAPGVPTPYGTGCTLFRTFGISNNTHDLYIKARVDHEVNASDRVWYAFRYQKGFQPTHTDPVNKVFNAYSTQPENGASIGYTHIFAPTLVNEFNPGYSFGSAIFQPTNPAAARAASPFLFVGAGLSPIFGCGVCWPEGSNTTTWQLIDNLTWTRGAHTFKFGENLLRTLESDHDLGSGTLPALRLGDAVQYSLDVIGNFASHAFAPSLSEPIGFASLDLYANDTWKLRSSLTLIYGLRATWNSDPVSQHNNFGRLAGSFYDIPHNVNQPPNQVILTGQRYEFPGTKAIIWQPRAAIAWQLRPNTVLRVGAGLFSEVFGAVLTDSVLENFPNYNEFYAGAPGTGNPIVATYAIPGSGNGTVGSPSNDALGNIAQANAALVAGFQSGVLSCAATNAPANCLPAINYFALPAGTFKYPYFAEWSAAAQQQFGRNWMARVQYAGTKATNLSYAVAPNGYQTVCPGCFAPYIYDPTFNGPDGRFGYVTQMEVGANSSYNALQSTLEKRFSGGLSVHANYTWSHCIDEFSNEGEPFTYEAQFNTYPGHLLLMRGNCDYDVRHSFNGSWVYQLPAPAKNRFLKRLVNGWEVSGNMFFHTGFPLSVYSYGYGANGNGVFDGNGPEGGGGFAVPVAGVNPYARWQKLNTQTPGYPEIQWLNPKAFTNIVDPNTGSCTAGETFDGAGNVLSTNDNPQTCQFARGGRNNVFAPGFAWVDLAIAKSFNLTERVKFRVDAKFYNALNHMNPGFPYSFAGVPAASNTLSDAFTITYAASPPTGLLGAGLGGDSSVRMIALSGKIEF
jgi:hypothetical protein